MKYITLPFLIIGFTCNTMAQKQPDLVVIEIEPPQWDEGTHLYIKVKNQGTESSQPCKLKVWDLDITPKEAKNLGFKKDDMWLFKENVARADGKGNDYDEDWEVLIEIPELKKGESKEVEVYLEHWIYDSNCEVGATIDSENNVKESDEENNSLYFAEGG